MINSDNIYLNSLNQLIYCLFVNSFGILYLPSPVNIFVRHYLLKGIPLNTKYHPISVTKTEKNKRYESLLLLVYQSLFND